MRVCRVFEFASTALTAYLLKNNSLRRDKNALTERVLSSSGSAYGRDAGEVVPRDPVSDMFLSVCGV